jgi:hypothetical protein
MKKQIPGARKNGWHWEIPYDALLEFKENRKKPYIRSEGTISAIAAAHIMGVCYTAVCGYCEEGRIAGAKKVSHRWEIPIDAFQDFKKRREAAYLGPVAPRHKF